MYDLLVIGGGINGTGIARNAAGRGLDVVLCEKDDLAQHTSSASTKLIHGGLRRALIERESLLRAAPHIIWPMRFVLPHHSALRPAWLIRLGLFLYDHLGGRKALPPTRMLHRDKTDKLDPLKDMYRMAFEYSDCWVEDSRLVVLNAVDARKQGAEILTRTACTSLVRHRDHWEASLSDAKGVRRVKARAVINAAGAWVDDILGLQGPGTAPHLRLVKGSHIIVRKHHEGSHAYFLQNTDGRIIFAIPYESGEFTLIGTTDIPFDADRDKVEITQAEIDYLCAAVSEYYRDPVLSEQVISTYSGVRPLYDDHARQASKVTRDYVLKRNADGGAPILSVFGGKITTYRELAEDALDVMAADFPAMAEPWTRRACLPGGDIPGGDFDGFLKGLVSRYPGFEQAFLYRLARAYGTDTVNLLGDTETFAALGESFGSGLTEAEVRYLVEREFAATPEDIIWRRSKLGLHMTETEFQSLADWMLHHVASA